MLAFAFVSWWYGQGWASFAKRALESVRNTIDFFSMDTLIKTLFDPYRQISAGDSGAVSLDDKFHAFIDRLVSRVVGFITRLFLLLTGLIVVTFKTVFGLALLIVWPLLPVTPVAAILLTITGVTL